MIKGFILAGARIQYDFFIKWNNLNPAEFPMLKSMEQLQGLINPIIIKVGTYYLNPLNSKIKDNSYEQL